MASVLVSSMAQTVRESLELSESDSIPRFAIEDDPDPNRKLSLYIPLDTLQATLVEFEEDPIFLNVSRTKFICHPPFDGRTPPRFTFYFPDDGRTLFNRELFMSVVSENEPFECDTKSIWTVLTLDVPPVGLARGFIVQRGEKSITIHDVERDIDVRLCWPNSRLRLERAAPFRTSVGDDEVLLGHCPAGMLAPIGIRYALSGCLSARLSYMFHIRRLGDADDVPAYTCAAQRQYTITNASSVNFPRVRRIMVSSETLTTSVDGHSTRAFQGEIQQESAVSIRPLFSLHETMITIPAQSTHVLTEVVPTPRQCFVVAAATVVPTAPGRVVPLAFDVWLPRETTHTVAPLPAPVQMHVENGIPFFDDITGVLFWEQAPDDTQVEWTRISLPNSSARIVARCINVQRHGGTDFVSISVVSHFSKPIMLAFPVYPGRLNACNSIEVVEGARQIFDLPWQSTSPEMEWAVFVLHNRREPIALRAAVLTGK